MKVDTGEKTSAEAVERAMIVIQETPKSRSMLKRQGYTRTTLDCRLVGNALCKFSERRRTRKTLWESSEPQNNERCASQEDKRGPGPKGVGRECG